MVPDSLMSVGPPPINTQSREENNAEETDWFHWKEVGVMTYHFRGQLVSNLKAVATMGGSHDATHGGAGLMATKQER